jgi:hypothetical protein
VYSKEKPLDLPDDDTEAFIVLCSILHHQTQKLERLDILNCLAVLADRYHCADKVQPYFKSFILPIL